MSNEITPAQQEYLEGLRAGDIGKSYIIEKDPLSVQSQFDFVNFKQFIKEHGHPNPQPADLYLTVAREDFLSLLRYADDRNCLILQCCFGFDMPPVFQEIERPSPPHPPGTPPGRVLRRVGQVLLLNKGNFHQIDGRDDADYFNRDTVFRNAEGKHEFFRDISINKPVTADEDGRYLANFRAMYGPDRTPENDPFILGYLFPVKALITLFTNPSHTLGQTELLTFRWGITDGNGNFTLVIGTTDLLADSTIEFRRPIGLTGDDENDCPPNSGC